MNIRHPLERRVEAWVRAKHMVAVGDRIIIAVSGGPDSVALLSVLNSWKTIWKFELWVAHFNHGLRGGESEEDARFVRRLCGRLGVEFVCQQLDLDERVRRRKRLSLQEYAREVRYQALSEMAEQLSATKIALGHTADDQAETVLMWMIRGSGATGLSGIQPIRRPRCIRPLLQVSRDEIVAYLQAQGLDYRVDSSNLKPVYLRNRIRQDLMPVLKRFNPSMVRVLSRQADILGEENRYLDHLASQALDHVKCAGTERELTLSRTRLLALPLALQRRVVRLVFQQGGQTMMNPRFDAIAAVLDRVVGGRSSSSVTVCGVFVTREYEDIRFQFQHAFADPQQEGRTGQLNCSIPSQLVWPMTGQTIEVGMDTYRGNALRTDRYHALFDASSFTKDLLVRSWRPGDHFCPLGLDGKRKKLQDFFSDMKVTRSKRKVIPLLVAPEGILWVVGYRTDHRFRVTDTTCETLTARTSLEVG